MKLRSKEVSTIIDRSLFEWRKEQLAEFKAPEPRLRERLNEIFLKELRVEDDLNKDVEKLLEKYEKEFEKGTLDRRKMFNLVKAQLAKEKRILL